MSSSVDNRSRLLALGLAMCDLRPEDCTLARDRSGFLGSACVQSGRCSYRNMAEYLADVYRQDEFESAEPVRQKIVAAVRGGDCRTLF
jgi:hypothetical protein